MSKPVDDTLDERRPLPRLYAHYHRLLIELLEDLAENARVVWLGEAGHIRRPDGQPNTYRKAVYALEDVSPYRERLAALERVQREAQASAGVKRAGLLLPLVVTGVRHVVLSHAVSWASHELPKDAVVSKLRAHIARTKDNLRVFEVYASTVDPRREKVEAEIKALEAGLVRLEAWDEPTLRERARSDKHTARLLLPPGPGERDEESRMVYVRDVGLVAVGPGLATNPGAIEGVPRRKRRRDRMEGKLEPLATFGNFEVFSERAWQEAKA